jgi:hypothetical protein
MDAKAEAREKFESIPQDILALSHRIHANPELGFEEEKACAWLADALDGAGSASSAEFADSRPGLRPRRDLAPAECLLRCESERQYQTIGLAKRGGVSQEGTRRAENGHIGPAAQGEYNHGQRCKAGALEQQLEPITNGLRQGAHCCTPLNPGSPQSAAKRSAWPYRSGCRRVFFHRLRYTTQQLITHAWRSATIESTRITRTYQSASTTSLGAFFSRSA